MRVRVRRVYEEPAPDDGARVLVDRIWPRGLTKQDAQLDDWVKDVAPSTGLRRWYGHDPAKFGEFATRYRAELDTPAGYVALEALRDAVSGDTATVLTATRDVPHSHAVVLVEVLREAG